MKGNVKFFNASKGFGFITAEDKKDYFVHCSEVKTNNDLVEGESVEFEIGEGKKGPMAIQVKSVHEIQKTT